MGTNVVLCEGVCKAEEDEGPLHTEIFTNLTMPVEALIQSFSDGTTKVLCPHIMDEDGRIGKCGVIRFISNKAWDKIKKIITERLSDAPGKGNQQEFAPELTTCPYIVNK